MSGKEILFSQITEALKSFDLGAEDPVKMLFHLNMINMEMSRIYVDLTTVIAIQTGQRDAQILDLQKVIGHNGQGSTAQAEHEQIMREREQAERAERERAERSRTKQASEIQKEAQRQAEKEREKEQKKRHAKDERDDRTSRGRTFTTDRTTPAAIRSSSVTPAMFVEAAFKRAKNELPEKMSGERKISITIMHLFFGATLPSGKVVVVGTNDATGRGIMSVMLGKSIDDVTDTIAKKTNIAGHGDIGKEVIEKMNSLKYGEAMGEKYMTGKTCFILGAVLTASVLRKLMIISTEYPEATDSNGHSDELSEINRILASESVTEIIENFPILCKKYDRVNTAFEVCVARAYSKLKKFLFCCWGEDADTMVFGIPVDFDELIRLYKFKIRPIKILTGKNEKAEGVTLFHRFDQAYGRRAAAFKARRSTATATATAADDDDDDLDLDLE